MYVCACVCVCVRERERERKRERERERESDGLVLINEKTSQTEVVPGRDAMLCLDV